MENKSHVMYSAICQSVLDYGELVKDNHRKVKDADDEKIKLLAKEISDKYHDTMRLVSEYVDYKLKEQTT